MKKLLNVVDRIADGRKVSTDTAYVARPVQPWTIKARINMKGNFVESHYHPKSGNNEDFYMENNLNTTFGVSANYRGLSLSLSVNPSKLSGKNRDSEIGINYYSNRFGMDIAYTNVQHFKASADYGDLWKSDSNKEDWPGTALKAYSANFYYVFNGRRFSYPAAFSQSWIQRKSAGSIIAGASFYYGNIHTDLDRTPMDVLTSWHSVVPDLNMAYVSVGAGYAYNYVPNRHWLLHASVLPSIMLWKDYNYDLVFTDTFGEAVNCQLPKRFTDTSITGRLAVTYFWKQYFIGFTSVGFMDNVGDSVERFSGYRWNIRTYFGVRL